ncbi:hypothetical protein PF008_g30725 [Phytophthora fragariae]|uniref:Uncharacterized protein n=1 Tax=Phytophthora fragariae TaxID=53985 RepID=A0A6G0Q5D6_9STRA|nr:hypothetical protein PF008_g30725 [Phytophthora fragariae]
MALQSTPTFQVAFRWLEGFYEALNAGDVVAFTERDDSAFPGLSQVSSVGGARLSQLSFANGETPEDQGSADIDEDVVDNGVEVDIAVDVSSDMKAEELVTVRILPNRAAVPGEQQNSKVHEFPEQVANAQPVCVEREQAANAEPVCVKREEVASAEPECVEREQVASAEVEGDAVPPNATKKTPKTTKTAPKTTKTELKTPQPVSWEFAKRPILHGMIKEQRKREKSKAERITALTLAARYRQGKMSKLVQLQDVAALLDGPYSFFHSKPMVDALALPFVDVQGALTVRPFNVGQAVPVIRQIPQLEQIEEGIKGIEAKQDVDLLAHWPDYGCATYDQLVVMARVVKARNEFTLVMKTLKWLDSVEFRVNDIREPFKETSNLTKASAHIFHRTCTKHSP